MFFRQSGMPFTGKPFIPSECDVNPPLHNESRKLLAAKGYLIAPQIIDPCPQNRYIPHRPGPQPGPDSAFIPDKSLFIQNLHQFRRAEQDDPAPSKAPVRPPKQLVYPAGRAFVIGDDAEFPVRLTGKL